MTDPWPPWSDDPFLDALRDVYFPGAWKAVVECEGVRVRTLLRGKDNAVSSFYPFPVYLEPLHSAGLGSTVLVPYLADVVIRVTEAGEIGPPGATPSPFIDWSGFTSFEQYLANRERLPGLVSPATIARRAQKLRMEFGEFELRLTDDDPAAFDTLLAWKNSQYLRTAGHSRLAIRENVDFYRELRRRGIFTASSLRAGGRLIGGTISYVSGGRRLFRVSVYDNRLSRYSAGSIMLMETLRACFESGEREFDFLAGGERYKYTWATHVRWLGEVGREPTNLRLRRQARAKLGGALSRRRGYVTMKELARKAGELRRR
jgi:CelD/BcsL family acetyltransferase involved in cellulose biosynthesis